MPVRRGAHGVEVTTGLPLRLHSNWMSCRPESAAIMVPENGTIHCPIADGNAPGQGACGRDDAAYGS